MRLVYGDLNDASSLNKILRTIQPDEIYNLGAQSHVRVSFDVPEYTAEVTALGAVRLLEAIRESGIRPKFYQASSSEMFGKVQEIPQRESTPFYPRSPYGAAKGYAHWITINYREAYNRESVMRTRAQSGREPDSDVDIHQECRLVSGNTKSKFIGRDVAIGIGELAAICLTIIPFLRN